MGRSTASGNSGPASAYTAARTIEISGKHLEGITLQLAPPKDVQGTIQVDGAVRTLVRGLQVMLVSMDGMAVGQPYNSVPDGVHFTLKAVPPGRSTVVLAGDMGNSYLKTVRYAGKEVPPEGIDMSTGGALEMVLSSAGAQVSGVVANSAGQRLSHAAVTLTAVDGPTPLAPVALTGANGDFRFAMVRPGKYKLLAWEAVDQASTQNPEYLKRFESRATVVMLEPGAVTIPLLPIPASETTGTATQPILPHPRGSLEGQVRQSLTGDPMSNVTVRLRGSGGGGSVGNVIVGAYAAPAGRSGAPTGETTQTDEQGHFTFRDLEPGIYSPSVEGQGMVLGANGQRQEAWAELVVVGEGQQVRNVLLKITPQAGITGRVVDELGNPLPQTRITVLRRRYSQGKAVLLATNIGADTDERGEYVIKDIPAGDYALGARYLERIVPPYAPAQPLPAAPDSGYAVTYFPGTADPAQAKFLTLRDGAKGRGDITLKKTPMLRLRGKVVNPAGALPRLSVTVSASDPSARAMIGPWFVTQNPDGTFGVSGLPPGGYTVLAQGAEKDEPMAAAQHVEVRDKNVDGVRLELARGREVEARIATDDNSPLPFMVARPDAGGRRRTSDGRPVAARPVQAGLSGHSAHALHRGGAGPSAQLQLLREIHPLWGPGNHRSRRTGHQWRTAGDCDRSQRSTVGGHGGGRARQRPERRTGGRDS